MTDAIEKPPKPRRRWLRFGLRTLLVLVLLLSLPLGWLGREIYRVRQEEQVAAAIIDAGGILRFDFNHQEPIGVYENWGPRLLRKLWGKNMGRHLDMVHIHSAEDTNRLIPLLVRCERLEYLGLPAAKLSDRSMQILASLPNLRVLNLVETQITAEQMQTLATSETLRHIRLQGAPSADEYLQQLTKLSHVENVELFDTPITNRGMKSLSELPLIALKIEGAAAVTNAGFAEFSGSEHLQDFVAVGTRIDEGCVDTLQTLPQLKYAQILPGHLDITYYAWGEMRLDTLTPVKVRRQYQFICGTFGASRPEPTGPRVVDISNGSIDVQRYDEYEVTDLSQP